MALDSEAIVFIIYITNENKPATNIELSPSWSFNPIK
jgi:hypothetical protein